jgi:polyketide synthase 12
LMDPAVMIQFSKLGVLSHDARCKSFDKSANGYVRSEGCGAVILKVCSPVLF